MDAIAEKMQAIVWEYADTDLEALDALVPNSGGRPKVRADLVAPIS